MLWIEHANQRAEASMMLALGLSATEEVRQLALEQRKKARLQLSS